MSEPQDTGGTIWDAPNKQVLGLEPPWVEGDGGEPPRVPPGEEIPIDDMTKAQLLEQAQTRGLDVDDTNTKAEIKAALTEAGG